MIGNGLICFVGRWSYHPKKKMTETLHRANDAVFWYFFSGESSITKQNNKFIPYFNIQNKTWRSPTQERENIGIIQWCFIRSYFSTYLYTKNKYIDNESKI
jgi:hypothetical protein